MVVWRAAADFNDRKVALQKAAARRRVRRHFDR